MQPILYRTKVGVVDAKLPPEQRGEMLGKLSEEQLFSLAGAVAVSITSERFLGITLSRDVDVQVDGFSGIDVVSELTRRGYVVSGLQIAKR